ncbi:MAG: acyltransferase, partial [Flavobacteriales bacterium]|nr:acyltransferase [Flavobacteriales bacterium]
MKRFPNLDALRFIAAALVVIGHTEQKKGYLNFKSYFTHFPEVFQLSELSVTFFFVLSGFLITYLIINDIEKQKYSIKTFYKKRI